MAFTINLFRPRPYAGFGVGTRTLSPAPPAPLRPSLYHTLPMTYPGPFIHIDNIRNVRHRTFSYEVKDGFGLYAHLSTGSH